MFTQLEPSILALTAAIGFDNLTVGYHGTGKSSPSSWLAVHDLARIAVARIDTTGTASTGTTIETRILNPGKEEKFPGIIVTRMLRLQDKPYLIAATNRAVRVYSVANDGSSSLLNEITFPSDSKPGSRMHSIEKISKDTFCVGGHDHLRFFSVTTSNSLIARDCFQDLKSSTNSMMQKFIALSNSNIFALLENTGKITIWKLTNEKNLTFSQQISFEIHPNTRATCIQVYRNFLLIGTISGQIQIINTKDGQMVAEIQAHVKCVTSMDVSVSSGYLISGSEDSFARMFKLSLADDATGVEHEIEYVQQIITPNEMIVGVRFIDPKASILAITTFESNQIKLFRLNEK